MTPARTGRLGLDRLNGAAIVPGETAMNRSCLNGIFELLVQLSAQPLDR